MQTTSVLTQLTLARFLKSGDYDKHIKRMSKYYKELREKLIAAIQQHFGSRVQVEGEKAGLHFLLHLDTEEPIEAIMERAEKMDLELYSIQRFMQKASGSIPATLIIGFAKLKPKEIDEAVEALCRCCFPVS